jgi:hypothetical protein
LVGGGTPYGGGGAPPRLARLGRLGSASMPDLAAELTAIGAEPLPAAADDDVWRELCTWVLSDAAQPELN